MIRLFRPRAAAASPRVAAALILIATAHFSLAADVSERKFIGAPEPAAVATASPLSASEEQRTFTLPPGFEIELLASESEGIGKFVTVDWDTQGRMWSMTALEYPLDANENPEQAQKLYASKAKDKVLVWDKPFAAGPLPPPRVFADGLAIPLGVLPYKNGVYVQHGPDIVFLSDTDGDGKADQRQVILSGFGVQDSHLFPHQFTRAPGGWIWMAQGAFNYGKVRTTTGKEQQFDRTRMARFRYDGSDFEITSQGPCNIWGLVLTSQGEAWIQEANDYGYPAMPFHLYANYPGCSDAEWKSYAPEFPGTAPNFEMGGTGLSGLALSDSAPWPEPYGDILYVANPIIRKVQALKPRRDGPRYKLEKLPDFIQSSDPMFRPVSIHFGPDGCLYIVDWYNKIISHNEVPRNHPERDKTRGRIWRIKHKQQRPFDVPDFTKIPGHDLLQKLGGDSLTQSHLAWQAIIDRQLDDLRPELLSIVADRSGAAGRRIAALWALEGLDLSKGKLDQITSASYVELLSPLVEEPNRNIRREAIRVLASCAVTPDDSGKIWPRRCDLFESHSKDLDPEVRAELIRANARLLDLVERLADEKMRVFWSLRLVPDLLAFAQPPLAEPTAKSTHSGRVIKVREAYDRDFERYLVRFFLEQHPRILAGLLKLRFLNLGRLTTDQRVLACLAMGGQEGAVRLAGLTAQSDDFLPGSEELTLLASFATEPSVLDELSRLVHNPKTQHQILTSLLNIRGRLGNADLTSFLTTAAKELLDRPSIADNQDLFLKLAAAFRLSVLEPQIVSLTTAADQSPERQVLGIKALADVGANQVELFQRFAISSTNVAVQREAVSGLAGAKNQRAVPLLIEIWPVLSPDMRKTAVDRLARSQQNSRAFVHAFKEGNFPADELDSYASGKLKTTLPDDPDLAALQQSSTAANRSTSDAAAVQDRIGRIRELASHSGDRLRGKALFTTNCMICHTVHGEGRLFGPVLNGAGAMDPESLLRSVVTPSAAVEAGYYRYRVETADGESIDGLFLSQNENEILLRPITGEDIRIPRSKVKKAGFSKTSLMPDGLLDAMAAQDIADLFEYLRSLK